MRLRRRHLTSKRRWTPIWPRSLPISGPVPTLILRVAIGFSLWDFLSIVVVMWILLRFRWSARMRDLAERVTRFKPLQTALYWAQLCAGYAVMIFPLTVYEGFFREHKYGLSNQSFGQWMRDQLVGLAVTVVLGAILLVILFSLVRRLGKNWWVWGSWCR